MQRLLTLMLTAFVILLFVGTARRYRAARAHQSVAAATAPDPDAPPNAATDSLRAAARALLARDAGQTYLDSMLVSTDSLVRRWPDRGGRPFRIAILEGGSPDYGVRMADFVREAASRWQAADVGLWFSFTGDSSDADITFQWQESFALGNKAGETNLQWSNAGPVVRAHVSLATRNAGDSLFTDEALLGAAVHELGHAIGLPHSAESSDVMFPVTRVTVPSARDRATVRLLYSLPPGSLRAPPVR
ncbi:MAG: matrixin family metalloprotease [Gemmatimonadales bacterium]